LEDGAALDYAAIGSEDQGHGAEHEHYGAPGGGFGQHVGCAARAEGGLAACSAEGAGEVGGFAALQQHYNDEDQAIEDEKSGQKPSGKAEAEDDDADSYEERYYPLHPTRHRFSLPRGALLRMPCRGEIFSFYEIAINTINAAVN
jgi:hypothetical protein